MKLRLLQLDLLELLIGHLDPYGVAASIERRFDRKPLLRGRIGNQVHNDFMADEWAAPPSLRDIADAGTHFMR